jgi:sigma-B regulation protein RsbU (phosphoserine phosphatase)
MPATRNSKGLPFRERSDLLDFLLEVADATSQSLDLDDLLASVSVYVRKVLHYELFAILLFSEKRQDLRIRYGIGHREEIVKNLSIKLGEGITGAAAALREPVLVGDVRKDKRYLSTLDAVRAELAVPMITRQKLVGVIDVQSTRENAYSEYDRAMLRLVATRVATAIDNARLYRRADRQYRTLKTLGRISQEFAAILELEELLTKIAATMRDLINYDAFNILLLDETRTLLKHKFSLRYDQRVSIDNIPMGKGITGSAAQARETIRVNDTSSDPRYIASHPDIYSEVAVPLIVRDRVVGVIDLESHRIGFFTDDHLRTLSLLAPQIATSIENARLYAEIAQRERRMQDDLNAAGELQTVLLPADAPEIDGLEVSIGLRPAREISGDLYHFVEHHDKRHEAPHMVIGFGDSSGKGVAAALYGAVLEGLMRTLAPRHRKPSDLMKALNDALIARKVEARFVTMLLMLWHPHSREFHMANAGGNPPMICRQGEMVKLKIEGVPLGLLPDREYDEVCFQARPGDTIVLYSDGISDHFSADGKEYSSARLAQIVRGACHGSTSDLVDAVFADLDRFNTVRFDDQTVIAIKVKNF